MHYRWRNIAGKLRSSAAYLFGPKCRNEKLALHAMFRNEAGFLAEWCRYHLQQGVDQIFLTNDHSEDDWEGALKELLASGKVQVEHALDHPDFYHREEFHKNQLMKRESKHFQWIAFLDTDEFLYCPQGLKPTLKQLPRASAGMVFNWLVYGHSEVYDLAPNESMLAKLTRRFPDLHEENYKVKTVVQTGAGAHFFNRNPHYPQYSPLAPLYWSDGLRFRPGQKRVLADGAHLKHYWYRTRKFFEAVKRPRRIFFEGGERREILERWHRERSNAVYDPMPAEFWVNHNP